MEKIREKVIARIHAGDKPMDISRNFGIARSTIYSIKKLYDESGGYVRRTGNCGRPKSVRTADLVGKIKSRSRTNQTTPSAASPRRTISPRAP
ncbi:Uncharacterized protein FKW44_004706 [Caligus rogercresseyi]|uniref:Paired domain-containing protein n=1 Tax=Caligus rogercresseyi TaxID=217165 RepID=A0A7T8HLY9_CALRO|nr:Uncharacterized protein FKW44_004706 [Caligus rogercresseyi]